jgi:putative Holliday junction resolvase
MGTRTALAFDYGRKRIGIATGQEFTATTRALATVNVINNKPNWEKIEQLIAEWQPNILIIGLPLNMDGTEQEMSRAARRFSNQLHGRFGLPVELVDERLTSIEAEEIVSEQRRSGRIKRSQAKISVDQIAAELILQSWFAQ